MMDKGLRSLAQQQAEVCRVFANATRILILWTLIDDEKCVGEISQAIDASLQSTSQHLRLMKEVKVLKSRRDGQMIYYRINESLCGDSTVGCPHLLDVGRLGAPVMKEAY